MAGSGTGRMPVRVGSRMVPLPEVPVGAQVVVSGEVSSVHRSGPAECRLVVQDAAGKTASVFLANAATEVRKGRTVQLVGRAVALPGRIVVGDAYLKRGV